MCNGRINTLQDHRSRSVQENANCTAQFQILLCFGPPIDDEDEQDAQDAFTAMAEEKLADETLAQPENVSAITVVYATPPKIPVAPSHPEMPRSLDEELRKMEGEMAG
jgi:hypothetical protein